MRLGFAEELYDSSLIKEVDVICPSCSSKARYKAFELANTYVVKPGPYGIFTCPACGMNKKFLLKDLMYFYHIKVGNRLLVARSRGNFIALRNFFDFGFKENIHADIDIDFPKSFYEHRKSIVKQIDSFLKNETGNNYK
ncbi:MAG: hypothetical protein J7604_10025 [Sporocytophaga sp.]|uniref:hypothetical protein n=1 Tax=Sporocytophaga sp. TaxID=2231183 RepID=UPI001B1D4D06|nr:hypothetical protein [Sporocytophaga sp.]MBO9700534.1 hypothetical protein [Sporocytophaga sp.]